MTRKRFAVIVLLLALVTVIAAAVCVFMARRSSIDDKAQGDTEKESEITGTTIPEEESSVEVETVAVEDDDAVSELYAALQKAVSGADDNMPEIMDAFSKSADMGNSDAMYFLGEIYFQGIGVEADWGKAGTYFRMACENGNRRAMSIYGKMLFMGDGVTQNYDESASCFYTATENDGEACYVLAVMSNLGMGVPRSAGRAEKYIDKATALGYDKAEAYRGRIYNGAKGTDGTEGFKLTAKKLQDLDYRTGYDDLQDLIGQYQDMLKETESYAAFDEELDALLGTDMNGVSTITLFGNNGYLFHQNQNDGTSLHDYIGDNHFSQKELESIAANLENEKKWVEQNGSKFVLLLIPNKETVFPEYMPSYIKREETVTREDQLVEYLRENTDIEVIYAKDSLMSNKDKFPIYYKTDTHANMVGSLFVLADLFRTCYNMEITPNLMKFDIHLQDYMGDLGNMAKCTPRYANDKVYFYPESAVGEEEKIDSSIMLVGDSFSEFINIEAGYYLKGGVNHRMTIDYGDNYHSATQAGFSSSKPEYVVWECVERYLYKFQ